MTFDWVAGLAFFATLTATTLIGRNLAFRVPALRERVAAGSEYAERQGDGPDGSYPTHDGCSLSSFTDGAYYLTSCPGSRSQGARLEASAP